jgi:hypothetical protein
MSKATNKLRQWWPLVGAIVALVIATSHIVSRGHQAARGIQKAKEIGANLCDAAQTVRETTLTPQEVEALTAKQAELQARMTEAGQPSLIQAELVKSAKEVGLTLREIQPLKAGPTGKAGSEAKGSSPQYRLLMQGSYPQIAEYLGRCATQRLPARVVGFDVRPLPPAGEETTRLAADITVEAYQPLTRDVNGQPAASAGKPQSTQ